MLRGAGIHTIGQIYNPGLVFTINSHMPLRDCPAVVDIGTWGKVAQLRQAMTRTQILRNGTHVSENTMHIVRRIGTFSYLNRLLYKEALAAEIKAPPSYYTRQRDGLPLPHIDTYCKAYDKLMSCNITSTTATAFSFAALNRTVWKQKSSPYLATQEEADRTNQ
jgi:hypothetical protein